MFFSYKSIFIALVYNLYLIFLFDVQAELDLCGNNVLKLACTRTINCTYKYDQYVIVTASNCKHGSSVVVGSITIRGNNYHFSFNTQRKLNGVSITCFSTWFLLDTDIELPPNWPCDWNSGNIPYTFNFYLQNPNRLVSIIKRGIRYIEGRSCFKFIEYNPIDLAKTTNFTYIYFTHSDVLEDCCLPFFRNYTRRRITLITPLCTLPVEVAHVILHALGLQHRRREPFPQAKVTNFLVNTVCAGTN